jgi:hypothetical protein
MNLTQLANLIFKNRKLGRKLAIGQWPSNITLETNVQKSIQQLSKYTHQEGIIMKSERKPGSGWEYEFSLLYFIDKVYPTPSVTGSHTQVTFSHSLSSDIEYNNENTKVKFNLKIDSKSVKTDWYETNKLEQPIQAGFFGSFHTHPKRSDGQYSFFSMQDISSLLNGSHELIGIVTYKKIFLACRTDNSVIPGPEAFSKTNVSGIENISRSDLEGFLDSSIILYGGTVGAKLTRF